MNKIQRLLASTLSLFILCGGFYASADEFVPVTKNYDVQNSTFESVQMSSVRFNLSAGSSCTGTWISNNGLLLTAMHCLQECLSYPDNDGTRPIYTDTIELDPSLPIGSILVRKLNSKAYTRSCKVDSGEYGVSSGLTATLVFAPAKGWLSQNDHRFLFKKNKALFQELRQKGITGIGDVNDLAIVRISQDSKAPIKLPKYFTWPSVCSKVNSAELNKGDQLFSISFPALSRTTLKSTYEPMFSIGSIINTTELGEEFAAGFNDRFQGNHFKFTTVDAEGGSSGAGVFDMFGAVKGVIAMTFAPADQYGEGGTVVIPLSSVYNKIPEGVKSELCK